MNLNKYLTFWHWVKVEFIDILRSCKVISHFNLSYVVLYVSQSLACQCLTTQ